MNARKATTDKVTKLFVLDTNVLMHDPTSLFRFEEHDVYLPMFVLEELDNNKKGMSEVARNARQATRFIDNLISESEDSIDEGVPLNALGNKNATGRLFLQTEFINDPLPSTLANGKADNAILGVVSHLHTQHSKRQIALVSKDINMRIKARALGLSAQDYFNDKVLEDTDLLYTGVCELPADFWDKNGKDMKSGTRAGTPSTTSRGRCAATAGERVRVSGRSKSLSMPWSPRRKTTQPPCSLSPTTRTARMPSGASPRATANRISCSIC